MPLSPEILAIVRGCSAVEFAALAALGLEVSPIKPAACEWRRVPRRFRIRKPMPAPKYTPERPRIMRGRKGFRVVAGEGREWKSVALAAKALKIPASSLRRMIGKGGSLRLEKKAA